ncbi:hypothetical protein Bca4012_078361 [Brassica carinata]
MVIDYENYGIPNAEYHSIVVRCFEDNDIYHVGGKVNPTSDLYFINLKLIFCDLDQVMLTYSFPFSNLAKHSFIKADLLHLLTRNTDL